MATGPAQVRAVLFDIGGVLVTSRPDPRRIATLLGLDPHSAACVQLLDRAMWAHRDEYDKGTLCDRGFWDRVAGDCGLAEMSEDLIAELVAEDISRMRTPDAHALALVDELRAGGTQVHILSNAPSCIANEVRKNAWAYERFESMIFSAELGVRKPQRGIYRHLLAQINLAPQHIAFVDDRKENLRAAELMGILPVLWNGVDEARRELTAAGILRASA